MLARALDVYMLGERLRFSKLFSTILLILLALFSLSFNSRAEAVQDAPQTLPTARTGATLSPGMIPMKSFWLVAAIGLIYCLRRPKKA